MACPFLDPAMLARLPAEKREEMKDMYHRMKKEENTHLKVDVKEEDIDNMSPDQMMMGMTGTTSTPISIGPQMMGGGSSAAANAGCPVMGGGSGGQESCPMGMGGGGDEHNPVASF